MYENQKIQGAKAIYNPNILVQPRSYQHPYATGPVSGQTPGLLNQAAQNWVIFVLVWNYNTSILISECIPMHFKGKEYPFTK